MSISIDHLASTYDSQVHMTKMKADLPFEWQDFANTLIYSYFFLQLAIIRQ